MVIDFDINVETLKKAKKYGKRQMQLDICLQAKVCPICTEELITEIDGNRNTEYNCTKCDFVWPQK